MKAAEPVHHVLMALTQNTDDKYVEFLLLCEQHCSKKTDLLDKVRRKVYVTWVSVTDKDFFCLLCFF